MPESTPPIIMRLSCAPAPTLVFLFFPLLVSVRQQLHLFLACLRCFLFAPPPPKKTGGPAAAGSERCHFELPPGRPRSAGIGLGGRHRDRVRANSQVPFFSSWFLTLMHRTFASVASPVHLPCTSTMGNYFLQMCALLPYPSPSSYLLLSLNTFLL